MTGPGFILKQKFATSTGQIWSSRAWNEALGRRQIAQYLANNTLIGRSLISASSASRKFRHKAWLTHVAASAKTLMRSQDTPSIRRSVRTKVVHIHAHTHEGSGSLLLDQQYA